MLQQSQRQSAFTAAIGVFVLIALGAVSGAASATISTSVTDETGDASKKTEPWQDVVSCGVSKDGDSFTFTQEMAENIPASPYVTGNHSLFWFWGIDTDTGLVPSGYPFATGNGSGTHPEDFFLELEADSSGWTAYVIERRPLVSGEEATTTGVDFSVNGKVATLVVSKDVIGDPSTFTFWIGTLVLKSAHLGDQGWTILDFCGSPPGAWPPA